MLFEFYRYFLNNVMLCEVIIYFFFCLTSYSIIFIYIFVVFLLQWII